MTTKVLVADEAVNNVLPRPSPSPGDEPALELPCKVIRPGRAWQSIDLSELWRSRELLLSLARRDVTVRYKQTVLGVAWAALQPAMTMIVFTVFFGRMAGMPSAGLPYPLFVLAGLLPWNFFASAMNSAGNSVVASERLITKIYFPRLLVPFAAVGSSVVDSLVTLVLLLAMMAHYRIAPGLGLLAVPILYGLIFMAALGLGTLLAALNVAYRDVRYVIPFLVQIGMFATPTIYMEPKPLSGGIVQTVLGLNPMTPLIAAFRSALLGGSIHWGQVSWASVVVVILFCAGCLYFRKMETQFADLV